MKRHLFIGIVRLAGGWMIRFEAMARSGAIVSFIGYGAMKS